MGSNSSVSHKHNRQFTTDFQSPLVPIHVTYKPEGYGTFTYSAKHFAYTNNLAKLADAPGPCPPKDGGVVPEGDFSTVRLTNINQFDVTDAVSALLQDCQASESSKVRILWKWLTSQDIHGTTYKLTEEFDEVEYQLQRLKNEDTGGGNTYAALFALLCAYANISCVVIRGYVKGSLYKIGQPITNRLLGEWNAVFVDGSWRLLDPFWGACAKDPDGEISSDTSENWFLFTEPRQFLYSHYPETPEWQLVDKPITLQEFADQPYLKERFFTLGMQDSVTPSTSIIETDDGEVNLLLPLDTDRAYQQEFMCLTKQLTSDNTWETIQAGKRHNQLDFMYYMKDGDIITLSVHVRLPKEGTYKLEVIGKERLKDERESMEFNWVAIYRVEVSVLSTHVLFPKTYPIGWGPRDSLRNIGLEAVSHQEGMIKFFPEDELLMEFKVLSKQSPDRIRLRDRLHQKNGDLLPQAKRVEDDEWFSKDVDGSIKFVVDLKVAAEYMLQICAEVNGRDVGSVCNYLIICVGEIVDRVLEEIKKLKPKLETAVEKRNLYELRQLINLVKSKALHRHVQMKDLYRKAIDVMESLQKREDILRKLRALNIPKVITELKGYNQVPDDRVEKIMKATFILLGVNERELKTWDRIRQQIMVKDVTESLPGRIKKLQDNMADFINDKRNKPAIRKVDILLRDVRSQDMEKISLAVVPLLEVLKLIVSEYKAENRTVFERGSTVIEEDGLLSPTIRGAQEHGDETVFERDPTTDGDEIQISQNEIAGTETREALAGSPFDESISVTDTGGQSVFKDRASYDECLDLKPSYYEMSRLSPRIES